MSKFLTYKGASSWVYALSICATWIWAPALFVSSEIGYKFGLLGLLIFTIPNALSLTWFGWVASKVRQRMDGVTLMNALDNASDRQKKLHLIISITILICSVITQLVGINMVMGILGFPKWISAILVSLVSFGFIYKHGIKGSIITDDYKYGLALIGAVILATFSMFTTSTGFDLNGHINYKLSDFLFDFGFISTINYFCALFADQTFWQRAFSCEPNNIFKSFYKSSIAFLPIPILFGIVGLTQPGMGTAFNIANVFAGDPLYWVLFAAAMAILISTIDSNLCAIASYIDTTKAKNYISSITGMIALLVLGSLIMIFTNAKVSDMFLIYGTVRTVVGIPTLLIVFDKYDEKRLFLTTLFGVVICAPMFVLCKLTGFMPAWIFTVLAFVTPMLAYKKK
jgi:Na+/proline symporter